MKKLSLKNITEELKFMMDVPESFANFLVTKWKKGELDRFWGDPHFIKKWKYEMGQRKFPTHLRKQKHKYEKGEIPPETVIAEMTLPDEKLGKFINYLLVNIADPEPDEPTMTQEERNKVNDVITRLQQIEPWKRPKYLFNIMVYSTGLKHLSRQSKRPDPKGLRTGISLDPEKAPPAERPEPLSAIGKPDPKHKQTSKTKRYKLNKPYIPKSRRG